MSSLIEIKVPDVGNVPEIDIVEVLIQPGDVVTVEQTLAVMETDKATMDLPSSAAGIIKAVHIKQGDKVSEGTLIATLEISDASVPASELPQVTSASTSASLATETTPMPAQEAEKVPPIIPASLPVATISTDSDNFKPHATPSVRLYARELGIDLRKIQTGSGRKGRILKADVQNFVKQLITNSGASTGNGSIPSIPAVDFTQYGEIEEKPLSKIKRLTGQNLTRVWLNLPLVTYHDEVAIDEMEEFRKSVNASQGKDGVKLTGLVFIMKALVAAMQKYPTFNSSLSPDGDKLYLKKYFHLGIAVDTPNGLVVPVIRDVDKKGIFQLTVELGEKSELARQGKLKPSDMQGGCMTISSLGGIGGSGFTPIVNAPEVAILGVTRAKVQPVWNGASFDPKLMLPLDITYDHRVIDGAEGARFMEALKANLADIRRLLL